MPSEEETRFREEACWVTDLGAVVGEAHVVATQESVVLVIQTEGDDDLPNTARVKRHGQRGERRHGQRVGTVEAEGWSDDVDSKVDVRVL